MSEPYSEPSELPVSLSSRITVAPAVFLSLFAALLGFVACLGALFVADRFLPKQLDYTSIVYVAYFEVFYAALGALAGWILLLLPVALLYSRYKVFQRMLTMCVAGALAGALLTGLEVTHFYGFLLPPAVFAIIVSIGVIDAVVATIVLIALCGRYARKTSQGA